MFLCKKYFVPLPLSHLPVFAMQATILNREIALKMINKSITDIVAVISMLVALVTGFMLHNEIHHSHIYHDVRLWSLQRNLWTCLDGYYGIALCAAYSLV
jgi:hypothetical protein